MNVQVAIATVKKGTTGMSFESSIGPSHPISEIATSHVCRLEKTRNKGDEKWHVFLIKGVRAHTVSYILTVKWWSGWSKVGDHHPILW